MVLRNLKYLQDDDNWSTASTFGESESKFSVQTDVQSIGSMKTSKSTTVIKKVGIKLDEQQQLQVCCVFTQYSDRPNTKLVQYSNGIFVS
jgi:hypothetical protein